MSALRITYLGLAVIGAVLPAWQFAQWFGQEGGSLPKLFAAWFAHPGVSGLAWDLIISAIALSVWIVAETRVRRNWSALAAIPATFLVGVSFGLPLYLFLRTRPVKR